MIAFLTGGTGFIGSHLADALISQGIELRCLVRNQEKWLEGKDYKRVAGDLHDLDALKRGMKNADIVFHVAGIVKAPNALTFERENVQGSENVLRLAQKAGVKKMIMLSSLAAVGPSAGVPLTENSPYNPVSMYGESKMHMEQMVYAQAKPDDSISIIRPPAVFGPREDQIFDFFRASAKGVSPIIGDGKTTRISMVFCADLVHGIVLAAQQNRPGVESYFISGEQTYTWDHIAELTAKALGRRIHKLHINPKYVERIASVNEFIGKLMGEYPTLNKEKAKELSLEWTCSVEKAKKSLNYREQTGLEKGIYQTLYWYKAHQWI